MKKMGVNELREAYLSFFESKGHLRLPSFPLIPQNEKSLLLINAGMAPLKPWFSGEQTPPRGRVTTCQKCIRTPDIERVGKTARHGTFFEMLGNFSFGDYFKREAIAWAWEFCTDVLELPPDKLYVSVYLDDDEAYDIWTKELGVDPTHMVRFGKEDNFWEIGSGPCGPCSEIYFDRGGKYGCGKETCKVGCDCDRYVEFWNLVFTQFNSDGNGNYTPLPRKNIDTGMGLERIACIMQGVDNLFEVDTIKNIMRRASEISGVEYRSSPKSDVSLRVITDHIRSTTMMVCDGVLPSNEGRGYVLRRLLRRAARHGRLLGIEKPFLHELCRTVIAESREAYPELKEKEDYIVRVIAMEEERFSQTLDSGLGILKEMTAELKQKGESVLSGADAFKLYDTFGFPLDLTAELLAEEGMSVDTEGFDERMKAQRERARAARTAEGDFGWAHGELSGVASATNFVGYTQNSANAVITFIFADGEARGSITAGDSASLLLDNTPFYAESGGQVCDFGIITGEGGALFSVTDVKKTPDGRFVHSGTALSGSFRVGSKVEAKIDIARRSAIRRAHSATHLLHRALREKLGAHVEQAGSYVEPDRLRFDFTHFSAVTPDELSWVENRVNEKILEGLDISCAEMTLSEAKERGAIALFGEKYGESVRVVKMGDFSTELCGGTHLDNTAKAGLFRIVSESSVAAGVRRIEAVTGMGVLELLEREKELLSGAAEALKTSPAELPSRAAALVAENKGLKRENERMQAQNAKATVDGALSGAKDIGGVKLAVVKLGDVSTELMRTLGDDIKSRNDALAALLVSRSEGRLGFTAVCTKEAISKGLHAGNLVREVAKLTGGNGGGRPDSASAGGKNPDALEGALKAFEDIARAMIK